MFALVYTYVVLCYMESYMGQVTWFYTIGYSYFSRIWPLCNNF